MFILTHTRLFQNLKARILKNIITWSEMGQQSIQAVLHCGRLPARGRGGILPYMGYPGFVGSQRVWFFGRFGHKWGIDFSHFGHQ